MSTLNIMITRVRAPKVAQLIAAQIQVDIVAGTIPLGESLAPERDLIKHYGVSRAVVREALRILESDGFVMVRPGRLGGALVCRPEPEQFTRMLASMLQISKVRLKSLLQVRMLLEPFSARLAAEHLSADHEHALRTLADTLMERAEEQRLFDEDNARLHELIAAASGNALLDVFTVSLRDLIFHCTSSIKLPLEARRLDTEGHLKIIEAILRRDPGRAERRMRKHIETFEHYLSERFPGLIDAIVESDVALKRPETPPTVRSARPR